jgi:hypothetical protein
MNATPHIIRQQYFHVEMNGTESEGMALQRSLPDLCQHHLMPALERVLDRYAPTEGHLTIERLEVDAGILMLGRFEHDLIEQVVHAVEVVLREQPQSVNTQEFGANSSNIHYKTEQQSIQEAFIYFLKTGSLPWSFTLPIGKSLEQVILDFWQREENFSSSLRSLTAAIIPMLASENVRKRLVRQFSPLFMDALLGRVSPERQPMIERVLKILHSSDAPSIGVNLFERQLWVATFTEAATGNALTEERKFVASAWHSLSASPVQLTALANLLEQHWPGVTDMYHLKNIVPTKTNEQIITEKLDISAEQLETFKDFNKKSAAKNKFPQQLAPETSVGEKEKTQIAEQLDAPEISRSNIHSPSETYINSDKGRTDNSDQIDIKEGIYINCAGLVLLHPFLPRFFEAVGIAEEDDLLQTDRALCLLHFLATGQSVAPEYELILPKILCNVPLDAPVESLIELSSAEYEAATALLEAVVHHWEALRNTSIDGLRGTFLIRSGKVSLKNDGEWLLQVESQSFDILLNQLPWGIGMIKLPWMSRMLPVEWVN